MKKKKFQKLVIAEAISIGEQLLRLESQVQKLIDNAERQRSIELHPSNQATQRYMHVKDEDGLPKAVPVENPAVGVVVPESKLKRVTFTLPVGLETKRFVATAADLRFLNQQGIAYTATIFAGTGDHPRYGVQLLPFVTDRNPKAIHESLHRHFAGRWEFVMRVENA